MRTRVLVVLAVILGALIAALPASADREVLTNWHVHSGLAGGKPAAFFPEILAVSLADYQADAALWAFCPNATDKPLLGDGVVDGSKSAAGICMNESTIIQILAVPAGQSPPKGWTAIPGSATGYFQLTARG